MKKKNPHISARKDRTIAGLAVFCVLAWSGVSFGQADATDRSVSTRESKVKRNAERLSDARRKRSDAFPMRRLNLKDPKVRAALVRKVREAGEEHREAVRERAELMGLEVTGVRPDGGSFRLIDFDENDQPVYEETQNVDAATTTAADEVRSNPTYSGVDGSGVTIGHWESGVARVTHRELSGRVTVMDDADETTNHATHVAGIMISQGINAATLGMAPGASIAAFDTNGAEEEMLANGAAGPNTTKLHLSNHSYGVTRGWRMNNGTWYFMGTFVDDDDPSTDYEEDFGRYNERSREWDSIAYNLPYYLIFAAAGNGRQNVPDEGEEWKFGWDDYVYDSSKHPAGNADYKSGWDNMEGGTLAKNVMAVGWADEGVDGSGNRDPDEANASKYSCRGPVDDGRIKPDIYGNGSGLRSSIASSDTATASYSGTSMSSPNVCGSAALLVDYYETRFPSQAMRASTLKALILHTADDRGKAGPDYKYGWGIMNTRAAADVIKLHADNNGGAHMIESLVNDSTVPSESRSFAWDGGSPLRVTLCWTDPPADEIEGHDNREKALVNDLNLRVTGPDGTHYPYVMPYVGDWSTGMIDRTATTGVNDVDNVEQVYLASPVPGDYVVTVDYVGSLTDHQQEYSLIVTGQSAPEIEVEEDGPPVVALTTNGTPVDFGRSAPSGLSVIRNFTVRNTGGSPLTGLRFSQGGSHRGDFEVGELSATELFTNETAEFSVSYDPLGEGARSSVLGLFSNDGDENPFIIHLAAEGLSELEGWRLEYFGSAENSGDGADDHDFDKDGNFNLIEFLLATDPTRSDGTPLSIEDGSGTVDLVYDRNVNATGDFDFQVVWTDDLGDAESWSAELVTEEVLSDDGEVQKVKATAPKGGSTRRFYKLRVSPK